ncbi:flagellar protein FlgN [Herbaspirillum lusitanum]|jgi:flagella synthesis protein FlgN|uniref:Flagellar protein FlgN n=1 Tax=Herbaspirillum lusitanum TaxID=213312 RepID=A0ABW9A4B7_9BURK
MNTVSAQPSDRLAQEKDALSRLVGNLQQEQVLLAQTDAEGITDLISAKAQIVYEMATFAGERHKLLAALGFGADENGMQQWMDQQGSDEARQLWSELFELAQEAKELNRVNGLLIGKKMALTQNAMTILQGKVQGGSFYGPDGQSSMRSVGRRLGVV